MKRKAVDWRWSKEVVEEELRTAIKELKEGKGAYVSSPHMVIALLKQALAKLEAYDVPPSVGDSEEDGCPDTAA